MFILGLVAAVGLTFGWQPEPFPENSQAADWLRDGPFEVKRERLVLIDDSRPTAPNNDFPGADRREFETDLFLPENARGALPPGRRPLALYLHGLASWKEGGRHFSTFLASHGYIVMAADFPLSNFFSPGGPTPGDVANQPGDVSFLINTALTWSAQAGHPLQGRIDPDRIALIGYSLGGMTATMATFHPQLRDPRIAATISIAGPSSMFARQFYRHAAAPFLMLAAEYDAMVPYAENATVVPERHPGAQLVTIRGGSHIGFIVTAPLFRWLDNTDAVGCFVMRRVLRDARPEDTAQWLAQLGGAAEGIVDQTSLPCQQDDLPTAINPIRQHMLSKVVLRSFLESQFSDDPEKRRSAAEFLRTVLPGEAPDALWHTGQELAPAEDR